MKKQSVIVNGLLHAIAATAYIALVVTVMTHGNAWFGKTDTPLTSMAALMLFVLSAAVMASLTFLRPILLYIDNKKRDALALLTWTIIFLFVFTLFVFATLAALR